MSRTSKHALAHCTVRSGASCAPTSCLEVPQLIRRSIATLDRVLTNCPRSSLLAVHSQPHFLSGPSGHQPFSYIFNMPCIIGERKRKNEDITRFGSVPTNLLLPSSKAWEEGVQHYYTKRGHLVSFCSVLCAWYIVFALGRFTIDGYWVLLFPLCCFFGKVESHLSHLSLDNS